jgi:hypothetical protein
MLVSRSFAAETSAQFRILGRGKPPCFTGRSIWPNSKVRLCVSVEEVRCCRVGPGNFTPSPSQIRT